MVGIEPIFEPGSLFSESVNFTLTVYFFAYFDFYAPNSSLLTQPQLPLIPANQDLMAFDYFGCFYFCLAPYF